MRSLNVLAISGSLRADSSNARLLRSAAAVAPDGMQLTFYEGLGALPHFNLDLDGAGALPPPAVAELRLQALLATLEVMGARVLREASLQTMAARASADSELERALEARLRALSAAISAA